MKNNMIVVVKTILVILILISLSLSFIAYVKADKALKKPHMRVYMAPGKRMPFPPHGNKNRSMRRGDQQPRPGEEGEKWLQSKHQNSRKMI